MLSAVDAINTLRFKTPFGPNFISYMDLIGDFGFSLAYLFNTIQIV